MRDLQVAMRSLARNPAFSAAAVISLALGIGANSAIFTVADQVMVRLLPVKEPEQLVQFQYKGIFIGGRSMCSHEDENKTFSYPQYLDLRDGNSGALTGIAAQRQWPVDIADHGPAARAMAELVSGNYFEVAGVPAAVGRTLTPGDDRVRNGVPYVVLSYAFWESRFSRDHSVLNRVIEINGRPMTVVGVAAKGFAGFERMSPADVFVPMMMKTTVTPTWDDLDRRNSIWLHIFGRLRPGVSAEVAERELDSAYHAALRNDLVWTRANSDFEKIYVRNRLVLLPGGQGLEGVQNSFSSSLQLMAAMVGTLLLIVCVNVANLLLTRSAVRQKEISIRVSLGASRWTLVRLMMLDNLLIAAAGGGLALLVSVWTASSLVRLVPGQNLEIAVKATPDARVLAFTALVSIATALMFGLVPSLQASRPDLISTLKSDSGRLSTSKGQRRLGRVLVVGQVTLSLSLLVTAGLFALSLHRLYAVNPGMRTSGLLQFTVTPSNHRYTADRSRRFLLDFQRGLESLPGAVSVSAAEFPLLTDKGDDNTVSVEGYRPRTGEDMNPRFNMVLPKFFSTMGVPLIAGREFTERDAGPVESPTAPRAVIVNETFVKRFLPNQNPIGRRIGWGGEGNPYVTEIVGVVRDVRTESLKGEMRPFTYVPAMQNFFTWTPPEMTFYVRTMGAPASLIAGARKVLRELDSEMPMFDVRTLEDQIDQTNFKDRALAAIACAFAILATLLAAVGLYGVTAYSVARRRAEIAIRLALGAERGPIILMVLREVMWLAAIGITAGVPLALVFGRLSQSLLFALKGSDPWIVLAGVLAIAAVSAVAGYLPARRAARIDPMEALRSG